jgi:SAM-dependent methyltransferase
VFAAALSGDGLAVGLDASRAMLAEAVARNLAPRAAYLRAEARRMPFADASFDAVCCYAALYLVPEPFTVLVEMLRVLAPGGRIALMTTYRGSWAPERAARAAVSAASGLRLFEKDELTGVLAAGGLVDIRQQLRGVFQFVNARRPPRRAPLPTGRLRGHRAPGDHAAERYRDRGRAPRRARGAGGCSAGPADRPVPRPEPGPAGPRPLRRDLTGRRSGWLINSIVVGLSGEESPGGVELGGRGRGTPGRRCTEPLGRDEATLSGLPTLAP